MSNSQQTIDFCSLGVCWLPKCLWITRLTTCSSLCREISKIGGASWSWRTYLTFCLALATFINEVHWALIFAGASLHSLAASMSNGTHRAIVAWWLVETDSTKYREYFLRHRRRYELLGSFCGALLGYYVHVHLYDGIFEGVSVLQPLKVGRRHRAVFLVASHWYTCLKLLW